MQMRRLAKTGAVGAALAGVAGLGINSVQGDDNGNIIVNPVTESAVAAGLGAGICGMVGANTAPRTEVMPLAYPRGTAHVPGGQALLPVDLPGQMHQMRTRGIRGAAIGAAGGTLLALANQLRTNDPGQQNTYV